MSGSQPETDDPTDDKTTSSSEAPRSRRIRGKGNKSGSQGGRGDDDSDSLEEYEDETPTSQQALDAVETIKDLRDRIVQRQAVEGFRQSREDATDESTDESTPTDSTSQMAGSAAVDQPTASRSSQPAGSERSLDPDGINQDLGIGASPRDIADFAQSVFHEGAIDPKHREEAGEVAAFPPDEPSHENRIGGWDTFADDPTVVESKQPISGGGFTASCKTQVELSATVSASGETTTAYVTDYRRTDPVMEDTGRANWGTVSDSQMASQVCLYAFVEAVGLDGPDLTHNTERDFVAMKEVDAEGDIRSTPELYVDSDKYADRAAKVSADEFKDIAATHLLAGNWDVKQGNVFVDESGSVHVFDYDRMSSEWNDPVELEAQAKRKIPDVIQDINTARNEHPDAKPIGFDEAGPEAITDRAVEIATALKDSGMDDTAVEAVRQYDQHFRTTHHKRIRNNIDTLATD